MTYAHRVCNEVSAVGPALGVDTANRAHRRNNFFVTPIFLSIYTLSDLRTDPHSMLPSVPRPFCEDKWQKEGISSFLRWVSLQLYPWDLTDEQLLDALTRILRALYGPTVDLAKRRRSTLLVNLVSTLVLS